MGQGEYSTRSSLPAMTLRLARHVFCWESAMYKGMFYVILNRKTPEKAQPFPEDIKHYYSNISNPSMYLGFLETLGRTFEIIKFNRTLS